MKKIHKVIIILICLTSVILTVLDTYLAYRITTMSGITSFLVSYFMYIICLLLTSYLIKLLHHHIEIKIIHYLSVAISIILILNCSLIKSTNNHDDYVLSICLKKKTSASCTFISKSEQEEKTFDYKVVTMHKNKPKTLQSKGSVNTAYELISVAKIYHTFGEITLRKDIKVIIEDKPHTFYKNQIISEDEFNTIIESLKSNHESP